MKLRYDALAGFTRLSAACNADWLSGAPGTADKDGLGSHSCNARQMTAVLKRLKHPVLVMVSYAPLAGGISQLGKSTAEPDGLEMCVVCSTKSHWRSWIWFLKDDKLISMTVS